VRVGDAGLLTPQSPSVVNVAMGETWSYGYDEASNLTTITDPKAHTRTFAFDEMGRETSRQFHIGPAQTGDYDIAGRLWRRYNYGGMDYTEIDYDEVGRLTQRVQPSGQVARIASITIQ